MQNDGIMNSKVEPASQEIVSSFGSTDLVIKTDEDSEKKSFKMCREYHGPEKIHHLGREY